MVLLLHQPHLHSEALNFFIEVGLFLFALLKLNLFAGELLLELTLFGAILARLAIPLHDRVEATLQNLIIMLDPIQMPLCVGHLLAHLLLLILLNYFLLIDG